jgi:hypothetical protein
MKTLFLTALAALMICAGALAQEPAEPAEKSGETKTEQTDDAKPAKEKKKGGGKFWNALKKGVESTTGLDVSKEVLFVYPTIGEWKFTMVSCEGDPKTNHVVLKVNAIKLTGGDETMFCHMDEARPAGSDQKLEIRGYSKHYEFVVGKPVELTFLHTENVPTSVSALDITFAISDQPEKVFEARDVPVTWMAAE